jgi:DnaJ-class molecular chaperone
LSALLNSIEQLQMPPPVTDERDRLYRILGIPRDFSNPRQLRNAYLREIWKYHPDRVIALINAYRRCIEGASDQHESQQRTIEYLESIREAYMTRTQEIQLAFETLGDSERRRIYDTFGYRCVRDQRLLNMIIQLSDFIRCRSLKTRQLRERMLRSSRDRNESSGESKSATSGLATSSLSAPYGFTGAGGPAYGWWDNGCSARIAERRGLDRCLHRLPGDNLTCSFSQPENLIKSFRRSSHDRAERPRVDANDAPSMSASKSMTTIVSPNVVHELALDLSDFYLGRVLRVAIERIGFGLDGNRCREECALTIEVEPGMRDGDRIEFPGYANATSPGADAGSVIFVLREKQHARFTRVGDDLRMRKKLTLAEALCGYSFTLKLLNGRTIMVQSHEGCVTRPGIVKRIAGKGMPKRRRCMNAPLEYGDLFIEFDIEWPHDGVIRGPMKEQLLAALATIESAGDGCKTRPLEPMESGPGVHRNRSSLESVRTVDEVRPSFDESDVGPLGSALTEDDRGALSMESPSADDDDDDDDDDDVVSGVEEIVTAERVQRLPPDWKSCPRCHQAAQRSSSSQQLPRISQVTDSSARDLRSSSLDG